MLLFDQMVHRAEAELPETSRVRLTYDWDGGDPIRVEVRLDLDLYRPLRRIRLDTVHHVNQTLDKIRRLLDKWLAGFERDLLVLSPEDKRRRDGEFRAWVEEERAAEQARLSRPPGMLVPQPATFAPMARLPLADPSTVEALTSRIIGE